MTLKGVNACMRYMPTKPIANYHNYYAQICTSFFFFFSAMSCHPGPAARVRWSTSVRPPWWPVSTDLYYVPIQSRHIVQFVCLFLRVDNLIVLLDGLASYIACLAHILSPIINCWVVFFARLSLGPIKRASVPLSVCLSVHPDKSHQNWISGGVCTRRICGLERANGF